MLILSMNIKQKIAIAVIDVFILVELCVSMIFAVKNPDNFTPVFFKIFLGTVIPTLVIGKIIVSRLRSGGTKENIQAEP